MESIFATLTPLKAGSTSVQGVHLQTGHGQPFRQLFRRQIDIHIISEAISD